MRDMRGLGSETLPSTPKQIGPKLTTLRRTTLKQFHGVRILTLRLVGSLLCSQLARIFSLDSYCGRQSPRNFRTGSFKPFRHSVTMRRIGS